jgi:alpha-beta hydrolase superfamily lysophospholipase
VTSREPFEVQLAPGRIVRGIRVRAEEAKGVILFLHEMGKDLDEFGFLPEVLARPGFDCVCIDLVGHGLSDGDVPEPASLRADVVGVLAQLADGDLPLGLVASGTTASVSAVIGRPDGVVAEVVVNPMVDDTIVAQGTRVHATRMVLHGDGENLVGTPTQRYFQMQLGEKMLVHNPAMVDGVAGLMRERALLAHVELFFKRYLKRERPWGGPREGR